MEKFERFCEQQVDWSFNIINIPAAALDKFLGKYFKDVRKQNGGIYEPDSISSLQKGIIGLSSPCSSFSTFLSSFSKSSTKKVQLLSDATSLFLSVNKRRLNFSLSLILFSLHLTKHVAASMKTQQSTKNWIINVEKILVLFWIAFHLFIWGWH